MPSIPLANRASPAASRGERATVERLQRDDRVQVALAIGALIAITALSATAMVAMRSVTVGILIAGALPGVLLLAGVAAWLWQNPARGVYVLLGAATLLPEYPATNWNDYIGQFLPFFVDLKSWTHIGIIVSAAELFMALVLLVWLLKGIAQRNLHFDRGSLMLPITLYIVMVLIGEINGVTSGGDFRTSLWEVRGQAYLFVAYILTCNVIKSRAHLTKLIWVLLVLAAVRGVDGTYHYFFWLRPLRAAGIIIDEIYPHEQSYFFNAFLTMTVILFLYNGSRKLKRFTLLLLPFVAIATLGNQRRASILALVVALVVLIVFTWLERPQHRKPIAVLLVTLALVFPPYYFNYQDSSSVLALPARSVASAVTPSTRDAASNNYRVIEDADIMTTVEHSPPIGYGFGKDMLAPYQLADLSKIYEFQYIMPHNSILWVWMRLGTLGYLLFWLMIGTAIVQAAHVARRIRDPWLKGVGLFVLLMLLQQVVISYFDLQWSNYRTMIATGILFALISRLAALAPTTAPESDGKSVREIGTTSAALWVPRSRVAADGRLKDEPRASAGRS